VEFAVQQEQRRSPLGPFPSGDGAPHNLGEGQREADGCFVLHLSPRSQNGAGGLAYCLLLMGAHRTWDFHAKWKTLNHAGTSQGLPRM